MPLNIGHILHLVVFIPSIQKLFKSLLLSSYTYKYLLNQKKLTLSGVFFTKQLAALKTLSTIYLLINNLYYYD